LIFKAVVDYEKYCKELQRTLVKEALKRNGNRMLAEHLAKEALFGSGLPCTDEVKAS